MSVRKTILFTAFIGVLSISSTVFAVDGYKHLKFGMSIKSVIDSNICTLEEFDSGQRGVKYYGCDDFMFGGEVVEAGAFFINGKFLRFVIVPPIEVVTGLVKGLSKKYGRPSSSSTQEELEAVDTLPNREAFIAFDKNTIYLKLTSDKDFTQRAFLIYTSLSYDSLLVKNQQKSISDDL